MSREYPCVYWDNGICQKHTDAESLSYCVMGPCPDETPSSEIRFEDNKEQVLAYLQQPLAEEER